MTNVFKLTCTTFAVSLCTMACQPDTTPPSADASALQKPSNENVVRTEESLIHPETWPLQKSVTVRDAETEQRITDLLARMTLEEKVGQIMQPDINAVTPEDARKFNLGSILNGGGSAPDKNLRNTPDSWLALADEFWEASTDTSDGGVGIPAIWGTDAVHGHSNIVGATLFPHNIGLGAANDPDLMYEIGRVTALEIITTGLDWTFAPTIAVARNDRWGRTYESYSEDPGIVYAYASRVVEGIQGRYGTDEFLSDNRILATAKHFAGDGGTKDGVDQGDNQATEADFRDIHAMAYYPAIAAGAQSVMGSYNSFHGKKLHGMKPMLTDVLVHRMGFDGFVVGDWNGHGQVEGCSNVSCSASFNAGLDMFMVPDDWQELYLNTIEQVKSGEISTERLDQAVARILRVKIRAGILDAPKPSARKHAADWSLLAAPAHRAIAREAVRKSLVLLKNENAILPLAAGSHVLVAGDAADNIGKQAGGWTLSWQGTGNSNEHFPNATSIFAGIRETVEANGGRAVLSENGKWKEKPDVAIVVFGEDPYAEGVGDRTNVDFDSDEGLKLLKNFRKAGIPTVSVFISGRALWVNPEINLSSAFVAAWLPGSEGAGVADVLFADTDGKVRFDFTGRLSFSWPANAEQVEVNVGDSDYRPLFPFGYGLGYGEDGSLAVLSEDPMLASDAIESAVRLIGSGKPVKPWSLGLEDSGGTTAVTDVRGTSPDGQLQIAPADHLRQEDTFIATWNGPASLVVNGGPRDFQQQTDDNYILEFSYQVMEASMSNTHIAVGEGVLDLTGQFDAKTGAGWQTAKIALSCFAGKGVSMGSVTKPFVISSEGVLKLQITSVNLVAGHADTSCRL